MDFPYTEAGEQCKATKFGRQVLLSFPSHNSKFQGLLHFANVDSKTSFAGYRVINVQTHMNRIYPAFSLVSKLLHSLGTRLCSGTINTHVAQSSHTINEGMMDIPVSETVILEVHTRIGVCVHVCTCVCMCMCVYTYVRLSVDMYKDTMEIMR